MIDKLNCCHFYFHNKSWEDWESGFYTNYFVRFKFRERCFFSFISSFSKFNSGNNFFYNLSSIVIFLLKPKKWRISPSFFKAALGIVAKILPFRQFAEGKIEAKSPPLSFLRKGNAQMTEGRQIISILLTNSGL